MLQHDLRCQRVRLIPAGIGFRRDGSITGRRAGYVDFVTDVDRGVGPRRPR